MSQNAETALSLKGKRVIVIGGTSGIGFAIAELACAQGATVVVGSRNQANVETAIGRLSLASGQVVNLRDEASVVEFFESVGAFDHLAITAGDWEAPMYGSTRDLDLARAKDFLTVRFWGTLLAVKHACGTIAQDGSITLTSGLLAQQPRQGTVMATAIAGAVEHLTKGLAMDLAPLRVNAVSPGLIFTDVVKRRRPEATLKAMVANQPLPRVGTPEEAAKAYVYLMLNGYVTGQILAVDGGGLLV